MQDICLSSRNSRSCDQLFKLCTSLQPIFGLTTCYFHNYLSKKQIKTELFISLICHVSDILVNMLKRERERTQGNSQFSNSEISKNRRESLESTTSSRLSSVKRDVSFSQSGDREVRGYKIERCFVVRW